MPCTWRRAFLRSINSSIVIPRYPPLTRVLCPGKSMSSFLRLFQFFRQRRIFVVLIQRIATRRQSVAGGGCAIAEGPANQLAIELDACRCLPEKLGIAENHAAEPHEVDPSFAHRGLRHMRQEVLQVGVAR